jgi:hypothetical protein
VRVQRTDALGERIDLALHLLARAIDRHALLLELTRQLLTLQGSGDESPELDSREEDRGDQQQCRSCADHQRTVFRQVELADSAGPGRDDLKMHLMRYQARGPPENVHTGLPSRAAARYCFGPGRSPGQFSRSHLCTCRCL